MSMIDFAKNELRIAQWDDESATGMLRILRAFYDEFDSGGAVSVAAPVLMRLIAGKPLTPITDEPDQWNEVIPGVFQHKRLSSVFKDPRFHDGVKAYDIDAAEPRAAIEFPYWPRKAQVASPVIEISDGRDA